MSAGARAVESHALFADLSFQARRIGLNVIDMSVLRIAIYCFAADTLGEREPSITFV